MFTVCDECWLETSAAGPVRLRCPDCKVTIERREDVPAYESIECPRCERYIMRAFWITLSQTNDEVSESEPAK